MHNEHLLHEGAWLNLKQKKLPNGKVWEYTERKNTTGACGIIATTAEDDIILVRQFRHPVGTYVIEFPAGLIDQGESVETAALRELKEETGCEGEVVQIGPTVYSSTGLTNEAIVMVEINVSHQGVAHPEEDEDIEVLRYHLAELKEKLEAHRENGDLLDAKLANFVLGLNFHK
jgi:8-oxo-dGTP pyrophosphatase MutT (NUDIX family)